MRDWVKLSFLRLFRIVIWALQTNTTRLFRKVLNFSGLAYGVNCGYAINPARDFGPRLFTYFAGWGDAVFTYVCWDSYCDVIHCTIATFSFREPDGKSWWWVPIVGPLIGSLTGTVIYKLLVGVHLTSGNEAEEEDPQLIHETADIETSAQPCLTKF